MSEPTRDDLRWRCTGLCCSQHDPLDPVTDEELEPIHLAWLRERVNPTCPECQGTGMCPHGISGEHGGTDELQACPGEPCPRCDGRGRLGVDLDRLREAVGLMNDEGTFHPKWVDAVATVGAAARALLDLLGEDE